MSGIVGVVHFDGKPASKSQLDRLAGASSFRGELTAWWIDGSTALGVQWSAGEVGSPRGTQSLTARGGRWVGVLEGAIDNREELAAALGGGADPSAERDDLRLLLAGWDRWRERVLDRLVGEFAFAVWDSKESRLFCARDPFGLKGVHYSCSSKRLVFASDAEQIALRGGGIPEVDVPAIGQYLAWTVSAPNRSPFKGVAQLPIGHWMTTDSHVPRVARYWFPEHIEANHVSSDDDLVEGFRETFASAVKRCSSSAEGTIGVLLSGGLDSTSIASVAHQESVRAGGPDVFAVTYGFESYGDCSEEPRVKVLQDEFGLECSTVCVDHEPVIDVSAPPGWGRRPGPLIRYWRGAGRSVLRYFQGSGVHVVLTGHGGDRLVGGDGLVYVDAVLAGRWGLLRDLLRGARRDQRDFRHGPFAAFARPAWIMARGNLHEFSTRRLGWMPKALRERIGWKPALRLADCIRAKGLSGGLLLSRWLDTGAFRRVFPDVGGAGQEFGISVRHPFFDRKLVEYVLACPAASLCRYGRRKVILRKAMQGLLPESIRLQKKSSGFASYIFGSVCGSNAEAIRRLLRGSELEKRGLVNGPVIRSQFEDMCRTGEMCLQVLTAVSAELWLRTLRDVCK